MRFRWAPIGGFLALAALLSVSSCAKASAPTPIDPRSTIQAAQNAIASGNHAEAVAPLKELIEANPAQPLARAALAHALLLAGDLESSIVQGKLAVGLDPGLAAAAWNLACAYTRVGDEDGAVAWLQRAVIVGGYGPADVRDDADLAPLFEDHRVAVFFATGVLSRAEEDVLVQLDRTRARVGEPVLLSIAVVHLNREPMSMAEASLHRGRDRGLDTFEVVGRRETFSRGEAGGREYVQRTVHFEVVPHVPGPIVLGPFRVQGMDGVHWTSPVTIIVDGEPAEAAPRGGFFALPSTVDPGLMDQVGDANTREWTPGESLDDLGLPRVVRFRLPTLDGEITLPARPPLSRRSTFLRRSTEGVSWVLDVPLR